MCTVAGPFDSDTYKKHSSCLGSRNSDHSPTMDDPEPGRCRRTDGRKWRCSKNAVPNQKYCERHMHRGRLSSRKHVEPTESISNPDNIRTPITPVVESGIDDRIAISLGPSQPCSKGGVIGKTAAACQLGTKVSKSVNINVNCDTTSIYTDPVKNESTSSDSHAKLKGKESKDTGLEKVNPRSISSRKRRVDQNNSLRCLSPKSVLKYNAGKVMDRDSKNNAVETEPRRCRRTDGKKWQCKRNALPNQKYCEAHMHRGAKRLLLYPGSLSSVPATPDRTAHISCTTIKNLDNGFNLNTTPTSPQQMSCNNSSDSTSDATTITDENVSICLTQSLRDC